MDYLIYSKDHLISCHGAIEYNNAKFKGKKNMKEKKHSYEENSSSTDEDLKSKKMKRKRNKPKFAYCIGSHYDKFCFIKNMDIMIKLPE